MFLNFCYGLNRLPGGSYIVALLRLVILLIVGRLLRRGAFKTYSTPEDVAGYRGWYEVPAFGCVAFLKHDGWRQYRW